MNENETLERKEIKYISQKENGARKRKKKDFKRKKKNSFPFRRMIKCNRSQITFQVQISSTSDRQLEAAILIKDERKLKLTSYDWSARYFESRYMYFVHKLREMNCQLHADQSTSRTSKRKRATKKWHSNAREWEKNFFLTRELYSQEQKENKRMPIYRWTVKNA